MDKNLKPDEKELLLRLRGGDERAFTVLYHRYKMPIGYHVVRIIKSTAVAEEIVQEVWLKVWNNRISIEPEGSFQAYIYKIAQNLVIDTLRRAKKESEIYHKISLESTELHDYIEERIYRQENSRLLEEVIEQLPPQRKTVFRLCKLDGKSYKETAEELGISVKTVDDHIQKATKFVRDQLTVHAGIEFALFIIALFYKS